MLATILRSVGPGVTVSPLGLVCQRHNTIYRQVPNHVHHAAVVSFFGLLGGGDDQRERVTSVRRLDVMMSPVAAYTEMWISIEACGLSTVSHGCISDVH